MDGRSQISQIKVHTDEQVHNSQSSLAVTHPSTNRARRYLTSVTESPSKHWSPPRNSMKYNSLLIAELEQYEAHSSLADCARLFVEYSVISSRTYVETNRWDFHLLRSIVIVIYVKTKHFDFCAREKSVERSNKY